MKKIDKKWEYVIVGVGLFIIVYLILGNLTRGSDASNNNIPDPIIAQIGDVTNIGNYTVTITDADIAMNDTGNKMVTLYVTVKNNSNKAEGISPTMFKLRDSAGRTYNSDMVASNLTELSLNPGLTKTGVVAFEVPADASGFTTAFRADMFGFGGAAYLLVYIGP